jgi:hypothetical protein
MRHLFYSLSRLRITVFIVGISLFCAHFPGIAQADESDLYASVASFTWKEFDDSGSQVVRESGPLFGVGYIYRSVSPDNITFQPAVEIFGGGVDYDGTAQILSNQTITAAKSTTDYFGIHLKAEAGSIMHLSEDSLLEPFLGLGFSAWSRKINNARLADGTTASGYEEKWKTLHLRLGLRGQVEGTNKSRFFAEAGLKLPVYTENSVNVTLHPGNEMSYFGEAGYRAGSFNIRVFYDGMRFSRSDDVQSTVYFNGSYHTVAYYQPRSTADLYGLKLGISF